LCNIGLFQKRRRQRYVRNSDYGKACYRLLKKPLRLSDLAAYSTGICDPHCNAAKLVRVGKLDELLDLYIRSAEISGIAIKPTGSIETVESVGIAREQRDVLLCCRRPGHTTIAQTIAERSADAVDQLEAIKIVRAIAEKRFIGLVDHNLVVKRLFQAVCLIDRRVSDAEVTGDLKQWTKQYKTARVDNPKLTYADFLHTKKIALVVATASLLNRR
jgi:hypothetical protein